MATRTRRAEKQTKSNKGRIVMLERQIQRLEHRLEKLEGAANARGAKPAASQAVPKLVARVDQNRKDIKQNADDIGRLLPIRDAVRALVRSFKQTPGAPFSMWTTWMLSTFRKQGLYRRQIFK